MAKQNYRCAGCGTRIDPGILYVFVVLDNVVRHLSFKMHLNLFPYIKQYQNTKCVFIFTVSVLVFPEDFFPT